MSSEPTRQRHRVLLIAPQPFFEARGTPMNVRQMCEVLTRAGYEVDLATYPIGERVEMNRLRVHRCLGWPGLRSVPIGFSIRKLLLDCSLFFTVLRLTLVRRYALLHAVEESVFLALPLTLFGARLVYDLDSLLSDQLRYAGVIRRPALLGLVRTLERAALRRSAGAITVCRSLTDSARSLDPGVRIFQVEDSPLAESLRPADPERVERLRTEMGLADLHPIVYTGNLESYQGIDLLLAAAESLRDLLPEARVVLVGGAGKGLAQLRSRLGELDLDGFVLATGHRPPDEMPEWMALADLLVSPRTEGENTPLKIYTYMHSGTPIVATDRLTHTQVLDRENAFLAEPTPHAFARAIAEAIDDPDTRTARGERARRLAETEFSPAAFERKLLEAYEALLG